MKLLLFDIDGTLIHSGGAGKRAMIRAFEEVYGIEDGFIQVDMSGKTDPIIVEEALELHGLEWKGEEVSRFKRIYFQLLKKEIKTPTPKQRVMPGVRALLEELKKHPNLALGLLTGNWCQGAMTKLAHFGLDGYFELGAFADDSPVREELIPFAVHRLKRKREVKVAASDIYIIGDTPRDIQCARPHGARTIAVATGRHSYNELATESPDYLFPDLQNTEAILQVWGI